ncbi:MAG: DUF4271 domain-containing protein [Muribaculaceae bacterium]|nr:DUF4271 domain-containing protein [Muribaculaceae bacterium]
MVQEGEVALTNEEIPLVDSLAPDSVETISEPVYGILLTPPETQPKAPIRQQDNLGISFILCGIFLLFLIIALRFHNNIKYAIKVFRNLVETRTRQNIFDDTVRETSLIVLLNILWCICAGVIVFCVFQNKNAGEIPFSDRSIGMLCGMAMCIVYSLFMWWAYMGVGWVFSDKTHAEMWVKGFSASQALMTPAFFLTALIGICRPETGLGVGIASAIVFILVKLVFIWKGYRIFFSQFSSWVLFLCYLCSLEIVPLILCYRLAQYIGTII